MWSGVERFGCTVVAGLSVYLLVVGFAAVAVGLVDHSPSVILLADISLAVFSLALLFVVECLFLNPSLAWGLEVCSSCAGLKNQVAVCGHIRSLYRHSTVYWDMGA